MDFPFFLRNIGLGAGLAMDASAVSISNGFHEPTMKKGKHLLISFLFALFQAAMPLAGYFAGHALLQYIEPYIPWIALALLVALGIKMIIDGVKERKAQKEDKEEKPKPLTLGVLLVQAVATSIDALSVGLTISDYTIPEALVAVTLIFAVTFCLCLLAVWLGKKGGTKLGWRAVIVGGVILIAIGIEICLSGLLG